MKFVVRSLFTAALVCALAVSSFADPTLTGVTAEGTIGTALVIAGTELGTSAPKVELRLHGDASAKALKLKTKKPYDGSTINATVGKITPGLYDLIVTPKKGTPITLESAFTARAPQFSSLSLAELTPGATVDVLGNFFGTSKGTITVADIKAKVKLWSNGKITFIVSKKNGSASAKIDIIGKGGTLDDATTVPVVAPISGSDRFSVSFDGGSSQNLNSKNQVYWLDDSVPVNFTLQGGKVTNVGATIFSITVIGPVAENTFGGSMLVSYTEAALPPAIYDGIGFQVVINAFAGNRIQGTFTGTLRKQVGSGPATRQVSGEFTLTAK